MNELKIFSNEEFGQVRTINIDGEPWFVGKEVTDILGYQNGRDALRVHVDDEDKADVVIHDGRQNRSMTSINESGMYALVLGSRLESAKRFKRWVTSEVLPAIRKTGSYETPKQRTSDLPIELQMIELLTTNAKMVHKTMMEHEARIKVLEAAAIVKPDQAHCIKAASRPGTKDRYTITAIAEAFGMRATALNKYLYAQGVICPCSGGWDINKNAGKESYVWLRTTSFTQPDGEKQIRVFTFWTQEGMEFLRNYLVKNGFTQSRDVAGHDCRAARKTKAKKKGARKSARG